MKKIIVILLPVLVKLKKKLSVRFRTIYGDLFYIKAMNELYKKKKYPKVIYTPLVSILLNQCLTGPIDALGEPWPHHSIV